jgi:mRNA-degrading endonuclease RelE of RelBE toxin-antitoxin system
MSIQNHNQKKIAAIEAIYAEYIKEIQKLKDRQDKVISRFIKKLEEKKIKNIRTLINDIK